MKSLPKNGDPYEEIYKLRNSWYGLLNEAWLNPAELREGAGFEETCRALDEARDFHDAIANTYHEQSFAHYGADINGQAWHTVTWAIDRTASFRAFNHLNLIADNQQGTLRLTDATFPSRPGENGPLFNAAMQAPADPGDRTVPLHSADFQLHSGKLKGIFRQSGYIHQQSYTSDVALHSTLYSLVRIAETMKWSTR